MQKYLALARAEMLDAIQEKAEVLIWMLIAVIPVFVMSSVWMTNQHQVAVLNLSQLITYYIVAVFLGWITEFWFDEHMGENIRTGGFSRFLLRPLTLPFAFIFQNLGRKMFGIPTFVIPTALIIFLLFKDHLVFPNRAGFLIFTAAALISFGIRFAISVLVASGAFWWEQSSALVHLRWVFEVLAGGYMLPISLYPDWLQFIPRSLPFQFIYYVPVSIWNGAISPRDAIFILPYGLIWLSVLLITSHLMWVKGVKQYSAVGDKG